MCSPRISPKENGWSKRRIPPQTPPPPLAKSEISRGFAETISPEKCFRKTESALFRHLPEYLEGRTPKKNVLSTFKKNFTPPPPNQESKRHFSLVLPSEARQWRDDTSVRFSFEPPRTRGVRISPFDVRKRFEQSV